MSGEVEAGRLAAHVMLDCVSAFEGDPQGWPAAVQAAVPRLLEVGAVVVELADDDSVNLEIGPLVGGLSILVTRMVTELSAAAGVDRETVLVQLREWVDEIAP